MEISLEIARKYENCYISEMQTIQWSEISRNPGMKMEEKLSSFQKCKPVFVVEWKAR